MKSRSHTYPIIARLISWLLLPVWLVHTLWRSVRDGKLLYLQQRLGYRFKAGFGFGFAIASGSEDNSPTTQPVWVHAASVGEVNTVVPLLLQLQKNQPELRFLITTITPTGKQVATSLAATTDLQGLAHVYLPIDYHLPVTRFLKQAKPRCALIVETEIWPCLYHQCKKNDIPIAIVNGRISDKTRRVTGGLAAKTIAPALSSALACVKLVLARSQADAEAFQELASKETPRIVVCGNLKQIRQPEPSESNTRAVACGAPSPANCLLASTHDDEEMQLVTAWLKRQREEQLIVVPRHPERGRKLLTQIKVLCSEICLRSEEKNPPPTIRIYIADTLGELRHFYENATVAFIGGSLVPVGGHNILEAAQAKCAMVVGPHMHNFEEEFAMLKKANAIQQYNDATAVVTAMAELLDNKEQRQAQADRAQQALNNDNENAADQILGNYLQQLDSFL